MCTNSCASVGKPFQIMHVLSVYTFVEYVQTQCTAGRRAGSVQLLLLAALAIARVLGLLQDPGTGNAIAIQ
jgi:hypothetical protein